ncbi:hypothetical protein MAPG_02271 [Magnaporthiopsis poae ATCC 64411]|uniref:DUF803 domain-containing protein n=1 Tax=Magnaporthiopsis poae (strain ATCC 64411 / 73-15) TaxID=644358 RepID=A0A0C4DQX3_MAGP6|nr:hypothetical protein MAPG_02271 [Magnaporthiopsis poae ATCC 64411]
MGSIGDLSPGGSISIGILVGLLSTAVQSLGITLQRKSHILEDEKGPHDIRRPPHRRRRWQLGMGMFIASNILGSTVQISTLPLPVLSTLQASGLVFNSICATLILGEPFTRWSICGTLLVCAGALLIAIFGAIPSPAHTLEELLALLGRTPFVVWMCLQGVLVISVAVATDTLSRIQPLAQNARFRLVRGLAYGCISGILSAHSLLVAKSAVELVIKTLSGGANQFAHWQSWVLLLALVALALTQLYYLHRGLKLVSTSVLYPLVFCIYNIIAILDGLIYFDQANKLSTKSALLISLGTVILLSGVLALSWRLSDEQHPPAVGQSSLAPGLGLVEDTDGEEEEEDLLLGSDIGGYEDDVLPTTTTHYSYQTFNNDRRPSFSAPAEGGETRSASSTLTPPRKRASLTPSAKRTSWAERVEIWGELEDRDRAASPTLNMARSRSQTLPMGEPSGSSLHIPPPRRGFSGGAQLGIMGGDSGGLDDAGTDADAESGLPRRFRKRRRSTGFPGFQARKTSRRKSSGGLQDAINGLWRNRWWNRPVKGKGPEEEEGEDEQQRRPSTSPQWPPYRDHPDEDDRPDHGQGPSSGGPEAGGGGGIGNASSA